MSRSLNRLEFHTRIRAKGNYIREGLKSFKFNEFLVAIKQTSGSEREFLFGRDNLANTLRDVCFVNMSLRQLLVPVRCEPYSRQRAFLREEYVGVKHPPSSLSVH